eukprot:UN15530
MHRTFIIFSAQRMMT